MKHILILFAVSLLLNAPLHAQEKNLALHMPVYANSENGRYPAANVTDGRITRESKWMSGNVQPPHILEINLQKYCNISRVIVHTGIPEAERTSAESAQAAGFWSAKNFKLQYWDDANWTDIPNTEVHENRLTDVPYHFSPAINTFKLRFVCDDGEPISIMEIEVFGTPTGNMAPAGGAGASDLEKKAQRTADQDVAIRVADSVTGKSMRYVAYNQGYYVPGSNASGWLEYAGVNSLRIWTTLDSYVPASAVQVDEGIKDVAEFDKRKDQLRADPEHNPFLKWDELLPIYERPEEGATTNAMILHYVLTELKRLNIDPVIQVGSRDFDSTWSNKWKQWQRYYALAYYAARTGDVTMYAMQNEPNHKNSGPMKLDQWIGGMQIVSDALTCAIEDVDKHYGKHLQARMVGPVTAGNNREWWTAVARNVRTDYHGRPIDHDLLGIFSTHSYNSPAAGYLHRVEDIRKILAGNQPGGKPLPIVYTEIGRWMNAYLIDKEETMDDPSLFTEWAGIYTNNTLNGAYGMWAFKFSNTTSSVYPLGIKSGHHFTWQGKRIVEDAYTDLAKARRVKASSQSTEWPAGNVTDGDKSDRSAWVSSSGSGEKWVEIDLGAEKTLGSAVVYTGSAHGVYTSPDRVKNYSLQYFLNGAWKDIPGFTLKGNKYAQVFGIFKEPVTTDRVRFFSTDPGVIKVREIKVFAKGDGPAEGQADYDISGIQRTGEVVRLFAKGFKDERPLYATHASVEDANLDALTSYDEKSGNYYIWLVQRGEYKDRIKVDIGSLSVAAGAPVTAECVGPDAYGEVTDVKVVGTDKKVDIVLRPQTVMLLTIPSGHLEKAVVPAVADATVTDGKDAGVNAGRSKQLRVALDASRPGNNKVSYIRFDLTGGNIARASRILLKVYGSNITDTAVFRFHVYGMPANQWSQEKITWRTAPQLDAKEALIREVGQKAFVAGELAMDHTARVHYLDVTDLVKKHGGQSITFALVRETRQLGDDADKGRTVVIDALEGGHPPALEYWYGNNATTYYINSRWGNDANSGKSMDDPWQSCRPLEQRSFRPGDSILFAKGTSYTGGFVFNSSGTADKPIVFSSYSAGAALVRTTPREKLADMFLKYGAGPLPSFTNPDWHILNGNIFRIEGNYIVIDGLYFHDNTNPPGSDHVNKNVQKMGAVYLALGTHHNIIRHCEFFHSPVAVKIKGSYNLVTENYFHDATDTLAHSWGPIAIMVVKPHNEICYNRIVNYGSYGGPYGSDGGVVEFDGVDDDFDGRDLDIHHNVSINNHGFLELAGRNVDSVTIAFNISDDTNQFVGGGSMRNIFVYNNTVVRLREPNVDRYVFWTFRPDSCRMHIHNNIFVLSPDIKVYGPVVKAKGHVRSFVGNQPHDHNLYFSAGDPDPLGIPPGKGDIVADPMFRDYAAGDFRLKANSPARLKNMGACTTGQAPRPNIIIIYADDMGYGDLSSYGGEIPTPNIDHIGRQGIRFTDFYDAAPVCTPSRYSLLTGAYPMRSMHQLTKALMPADKNYLDRKELTLAHYLKQAHYSTALIGKWHLGLETPASSPTVFGFDEFTGFKGGAIDYYTHAYARLPMDWYVHDRLQQEQGYSTDLITRHAIEFIDNQDQKKAPFFLYLAYNAPHYGKTDTSNIKEGYTLSIGDAKKTGAGIINSLQAPREYVDRFSSITDPYRRVYAAMVASLDDNVGRLISALQRDHLLENTMIWFISDNGGYAQSLHGHASNGGLRGEKASLYEGGIRVPAMVWWQHHIKPGQVVHDPLCNVDLAPTLAAIAGAGDSLHKATIDGRDIRQLLFHHEGVKRDLLWVFGRQTALRSGNWKLVNGAELYDLSVDKYEKADLAARYPARVAELKARLERAEARVKEGEW